MLKFSLVLPLIGREKADNYIYTEDTINTIIDNCPRLIVLFCESQLKRGCYSCKN
jgi:hypothetical protein